MRRGQAVSGRSARRGEAIAPVTVGPHDPVVADAITRLVADRMIKAIAHETRVSAQGRATVADTGLSALGPKPASFSRREQARARLPTPQASHFRPRLL